VDVNNHFHMGTSLESGIFKQKLLLIMINIENILRMLLCADYNTLVSRI